jgi:hypothetical protein
MSISLAFTDDQVEYSPYILQNITERKALIQLKNAENKSWIFRFDYITQRYYLTIKKDDEYINHSVGYYNRKTNQVFNQKKYTTLDEYIREMKNVYDFDLSKQIIG